MGFKVTDDGREEDPQGEGRHVFPQEGPPSGAGGSWGDKGKRWGDRRARGLPPSRSWDPGRRGGEAAWGGGDEGREGAEGDCHADP